MITKLGKYFTKKENSYLFFGLLIGFVMVFLMPPFESPDEWAHYFKSWEVAGGQLRCGGVGLPGNEIPQGAEDLSERLSLSKNNKFKLDKIKKDISVEPSYEKSEINKSILCGATPFGFIIPGVVLRIGEAFNFPLSISFYLGRIFNMIASVLIVYWAIRMVPFGKGVFFIVGLLPIVSQQFSSFSYDALHIASILLFIAYILKLRSEREQLITKKELGFLFTLSFVALNVKFGYFPLASLILLLPQGKFETRKKAFIFKAFFIAANVLFFLLCYKIFQAPPILPEGVNVNQQILFVLHHPLKFLDAVINSFNKFGFTYFQGIIGIVGPFRKSFPILLYLGGFFGMFFLLSKEDETVDLAVWERVSMALIAFVNMLLVFFVLYLIWNPVGAKFIDGVQGRYLVVLFLLFILSLYKLTVKIKKRIQYAFFVYVIVLFTVVFSVILDLYY